MSASVAKVRSIALSYGVFKETGPVTARSLQLANEVSVKVVGKIWNDWGVDLEGWGSRKDEVDLYTVSLRSEVGRSGRRSKLIFRRVVPHLRSCFLPPGQRPTSREVPRVSEVLFHAYLAQQLFVQAISSGLSSRF